MARLRNAKFSYTRSRARVCLQLTFTQPSCHGAQTHSKVMPAPERLELFSSRLARAKSSFDLEAQVSR